jgi:hypothetical protein
VNAFVKINRSDMPYNRGELFYTVCRTDADGRMWAVADAALYPYAWGFSEIKHALRVVDNCNDTYSEISTDDLIRQLAAVERNTTQEQPC